MLTLLVTHISTVFALAAIVAVGALSWADLVDAQAPEDSAIPGSYGLDFSRMRMSSLGDTHRIYVGLASEPAANSPLRILVEFTDTAGRPVSNVNYDVTVSQRGSDLVVLRNEHDDNYDLRPIEVTTRPLPFGAPVDVTIMFHGFGNVGSELRGPTGTTIGFRQVRTVTDITQVGAVVWLQDMYPAPGGAVVRVTDSDMNRDRLVADRLSLRIFSASDPTGVAVSAVETGANTGEFDAAITTITSGRSSGSTLYVSQGDKITARYDDQSVPSAGASSIRVEGDMVIGEFVPYLERVKISDVNITDKSSNAATREPTGEPILISSTITNSLGIDQKYAYVVQVNDADDSTVSLTWSSGTLRSGQTTSPSSSWVPSSAGEHIVSVFVWRSIDDPVPLSAEASSRLTIVGGTGPGGAVEPHSRFVPYMVQGDDPQVYVDRYDSDPAYRAWFDSGFPDLTIWRAVGLADTAPPPPPPPPSTTQRGTPDPAFAPFMSSSVDPQVYVDRYNSDRSYREWFDTNFAGLTIRQAVGLDRVDGAADAPIELRVSRDTYTVGSSVLLAGTVNERIAGSATFVRVFAPNGDLYEISQANLRDDGRFVHTITTTPTWVSGKYTIEVSHASEIARVTVDITGGAQLPRANTAISIDTDMASYVSGQIVAVRGSVNELSPSAAVTISVKSPDGILVVVDQITPSKDNTFATSFHTFGWAWNSSGTYTITARYGSSAMAEATIQFTNRAVPVSAITLSADRASYAADDVVTITGAVANVAHGALTLVVTAPDGNRVLLTQPNLDANNRFKTTFTAGGSLWENPGTYTVKVTYGPTGSLTAQTTIEYAGGVPAQEQAPRPRSAIDSTLAGIVFDITGGEVISIARGASGSPSIEILIDATDDGKLTLGVPRIVLDSRTEGAEGDDVPFSVLIDGEIVDAVESNSIMTRTLIIDFSADDRQVIEIIGSWIVDMRPGVAATVSVSTNRADYTSGDSIVVSGSVTSRSHGDVVYLRVLTPSGHEVYSSAVDLDRSNSYSHRVISVSDWGDTEAYKVRATYGSSPVAEVSINIVRLDARTTVTLTTDKARYSHGDIVTITGQLGERPRSELTIEVLSPGGSLIYSDAHHLGSSTTFTSEFVITDTKWKGVGIYTISAVDEMGSSRTVIGRIAIEFVGNPPARPPTPGSITISTDRPSYASGSTVTVTGTRAPAAYEFLQGSLNLVITAPNGASVISGYPTLGSDGSFEHTFAISGSLWSDVGTYTITLELTPDPNRVVIDETTIEYLGDATPPAPTTVLVISPIPQQSALVGSTLTFTATPTDPSFTDLSWGLGGTALAGASISSRGVFEWTPQASALTDPAGVTYTVVVNATDGQQSAGTSVTIVLMPQAETAPQPTITMSSRTMQYSFMVNEQASVSISTDSTYASTVTGSVDVSIRHSAGGTPLRTTQVSVTIPTGASTINVDLGTHAAPTTLNVDMALSHMVGGEISRIGTASTVVYIVGGNTGAQEQEENQQPANVPTARGDQPDEPPREAPQVPRARGDNTEVEQQPEQPAERQAEEPAQEDPPAQPAEMQAEQPEDPPAQPEEQQPVDRQAEEPAQEDPPAQPVERRGAQPEQTPEQQPVERQPAQEDPPAQPVERQGAQPEQTPERQPVERQPAQEDLSAQPVERQGAQPEQTPEQQPVERQPAQEDPPAQPVERQGGQPGETGEQQPEQTPVAR